MNATINSIGIYHPQKAIKNTYFEDFIETSDQWIKERTGIENRFFSLEHEYTSDLCVKAVQALVKDYKVKIEDIDFIIVATSTPDQVLPSVASQVQSRINIPNAGCIDISAACGGFVYGLILAKGLIAAKTHRKVLVIGAETLSKVTDFTDRSSCILFGDAAGAVIVEASKDNYILNAITDTDGSYGQELYLSYKKNSINGKTMIPDGNIHQNGRAVFKWAVTTLIRKIKDLIAKNGMNIEDIDFFIPHSANIRILESVCKELGIPMNKCIESIRNYGNTSAASIPLAWYDGIISGKIKPKDKLLLIGFGGGLTCAGICLQNNIARK